MSANPNGTNPYPDPHDRYAQLVESIDGIVWEADARTFQFTFVSAQAERLLGYPLEQWLRPGFWAAHLHPADRDWAVEFCVQATQEQRKHDFEYRMRARDGRTVWLRDIVTVVVEGGEATRLRGIMVDVTDHKRTEQALRETERQLRTLVENFPDFIARFDREGRRLYVNPSVTTAFGLPPEHFLGKSLQELEMPGPPGQNEELQARMRQAVEAGLPNVTEARWWTTQGERVFEVRHIPERDEGGNVVSVLAIGRDVTERKRAEQALRESHGLLNAVVEGTSDAVFVKDLNGRFLLVNSAGARFLGKSVGEVIGKSDQELLPPDVRQAVRERELQVLATGRGQTFEQTVTLAGVTGTYLSTTSAFRDAQGNVIGVVGIAWDVTELKRLEEQFRQSQKMEAVGRLAGGIAHDFNNLLTVINGCSDMVFNDLRPEDPNREMLAEIQKAGERAANLTRQLLAFSRKQILQLQIVNLNELLGELHKLLGRLIGEDVELALVPAPDLGLAKVDPGQFEQAIMNLAVNAQDAMPRGGRLTIETRNAELDEGYARRHPEARPGRYIRVAVRDTGHGMDEATRARVFEPFFTTKEIGKGTGLGLAMVYGFVKQSGGHVEVHSEPGRGTTFEVYLPHAEAGTPSPKSSPGLVDAPKGTETVLLVEDEDAVRALSRIVLQSSGYTVLEARDGEEAVGVARQHPGPIHLLVTDLVMPRMSGWQLADVLTRARPRLRVLFMSGYVHETMPQHGVPDAGVALLQKPFSPIGLARKVREVLDEKVP